MQELKMQNGLLLQLVKGLQNQINSKNRENHILFQQYEQLASDNSAMRAQIDALKSKHREQNIDTQINSPRQQENVHLKQKIALLQEQIRGLAIQLDQKGGSIIFLQSQLQEAKGKLASYEQSQNQDSKTQTSVRRVDQSRSVEDAQISNQLNRKLQSFESQIQEKQVLLDSLSKQNEELKQKIVSLENLQSKDKQSIESLTIELNQQKLILVSKEQSVNELSQFLSSLTTKSQEAAQKQADLQTNLKQALNRMMSMEQERQKLQNEIVQLKQQRQKREGEQIKQNQVTSTKEIEVDEMQVKLSTKQDELFRANQIIAEKDRTISECFERINQLSEKIMQIQNKNQQQQSDSQINQQISTKDQTIAQLSEYLNDQLQTITQLRQKVKQLQEIKPIQNRDQQKNESNLIQNQKISDLQNLLKNKEESLIDMSAYIEENNEKLAKLQQSYKALLSQNELLKQSLNKGKGEYLEEDTSNLKELQQKIASKDLIIAEFTEFINQQSIKVASIEQEKTRMIQQEGQKYQDIVSSLNQRIQLLEQTLRQKEQQINTLNSNNIQQQAKILEKQARIAELQIKCSQANTIPPQKVKQLQEILAKEGSLIVNLTQKVQQLEARELQLQRQLEAVQQKYRARDIEIARQQKNTVSVSQTQQETSCVNIEQIQRLNQSITQLEAIINSKSDTIAQLSQFMNEQAIRISELEAQVENNQSISVENRVDQEKIDELEAIIKMKEQSVAQLREYLEQNAAKNIELQKKVIQLEAESKKAEQEQLNQIQKIQQIEVVGQACKKEQLTELQSLIEQKKLELQSLNVQCQKNQQNKIQILKTIQVSQNTVNNLKTEKLNLQAQIEQIKSYFKDMESKKQQVQLLAKQFLSNVEEINQKEDFKFDRQEKESEINGLSDIIEKLQDQLRSKNEIIQYLQERGNQNKNAQSEGKNQNMKVEEYQNKIAELEKQVKTLRVQHKQLTQRLESVQVSSILQEKYDIVGMERQLQLESKLFNDSYKKQLNELDQSKKQSDLEQQNEQDEFRVQQNQKALNTGQLLSQILVYSEDKNNSKVLQKLVKALTERYLAEFEQYQAQNKKLRAQFEDIASKKDYYENNINTLNLQIKQLNQQINQKNQLIESLHDLNGQKEKSFNEKIEEIRNSFQVTGNEFHLNLNSKQGKEIAAEPITQQVGQEQFQILKKENAHLQQLVKELKEELQILLAENKNKAAQIKSLKEAYKQPAMEKEFVDLLRDSNSNINEEGIDQHEIIEILKSEKEVLTSKCTTIELKLKQIQKERQRHLQTIETLQKQLNEHQCQKARDSEQSQTKNKVLSQLYVKKQEQRMQSEMSEQKEHALIQKIMQKNEIIAELEETVLKLQKGYNHQIMELRKNNAELNGQIINLTKKIYLLDPNSIDVADFVKETCRQAVSETQFYKSRYNLKYTSHYSQVQQPHNSSYLTEHSRSKRYEPFFNHKELTLGEKILGRRCRGDPLNYTINHDYRLNASAWQMQATRPL